MFLQNQNYDPNLRISHFPHKILDSLKHNIK